MAETAKKKPAAKRASKPAADERPAVQDPVVEQDVRTPEQGRGAGELQAKRDALGVGHVHEPPRHSRTEVGREFEGVNGGKLTVSTADGVVTIRADKNVELDQALTLNVRNFLDVAFQAVS